MATLTLSGGRKAEVEVVHRESLEVYRLGVRRVPGLVGKDKDGYLFRTVEERFKPGRVTTVRVTVTDADDAAAVTLVGEALCHPKDNFSRQEGRLVAMKKIFEEDDAREDAKVLARPDRSQISRVLLPRLSHKKGSRTAKVTS